MKKIIIKIDKNKRRLLSNFFSLSVLQAANYLLPLITLPYLLRVVGAEKYGVIAFAQAFIQYFIVFSEYGFTLTATRAIATQREDIVSISKIFSAVMVIKFIIMIICLIIYVLIVVFVDKMFNERFVYYYIFGMVFGNILFPGWLFQGIEKMEYITLLNLLSKTIFTICIFVFIKDTADYFYVPLINSLGSISAGLIAIIIAFKRFKIFFIMPHRNDLLHYVKDGWHIFISTISINFYKMNNVIILGFCIRCYCRLFCDIKEVG